ncbi:hypothetical protein [Mesorhizobium australicum]|uniref:hypothetical protein n=1 Tax=Mesorhizobium australicum TaxID=536018 RepID=UPI00111C7754|nr:hypothetical protein [Mesorhizobium australicum]
MRIVIPLYCLYNRRQLVFPCPPALKSGRRLFSLAGRFYPALPAGLGISRRSIVRSGYPGRASGERVVAGMGGEIEMIRSPEGRLQA